MDSDEVSFWKVAVVCFFTFLTVSVIGCQVSETKQRISPIENGLCEMQMVGSQSTIWTSCSK